VAAPVGAAAALLGVAIVVQEQNLTAGVANRVLSHWARAISVSHDRVARRLGPRAVVTGVPVRRGALGGDRARGRRAFRLEDRPLTILVLGGSQGARSLNAAVVDMAAAIPVGSDVQILHQTGQDHLEWVRARIATRSSSVHHVVVPYIEAMADAYAAADIVICRAGAATLAEVTANGLPVIAVPYRFAAEGHQELNAQVVAAAGAALVINDHDLSAARLAGAVAALRADPSRRKAMAEASRALGRPQAAQHVAGLILKAAGASRA
jgi:UDP-N-acetylglucosamine--N-acetylmuramyl-(pentapeptide) pyrophosphoryl-undecaprenol N-acetylglucosamine transferase